MKWFQVLQSLVLLLAGCVFTQAQVVATNTNAVVPPLINFSGTLMEPDGKPLSGTVAVTFSLYFEQTGGAALWMETQNVQPDVHGNYTVMLGSTSSSGLPSDIFVAGQAHWLGVQVEGEAEQPRVLLVSAPYALKAGDAQTIGGLPPSAFVLAAPVSAGSTDNASPTSTAAANNNASAVPPTTSDVTTSGGTANVLPLFSTATNIQNSIVTQSGKAAISVAGKLNLPATGTATSSGGKDSQAETFAASSYDSGTSAAVAQTFQWQAQPAGNDTPSPSATLNLLFGSGTATPAETGLNIASDGLITFSKGQTFPGAGTITGVTTATGSGLSGGGTSGTLSLSLATTCSTNQVLQWNGSKWACSSAGTGTITGVTAGTDLTGGGTTGSVTLNVDTTKIPQLSAANTFTGNQTITGNLSDTGNISATGEVTAQNEQLTNSSFAPTLYVSQSGNGNGIYVNAPGSIEAISASSNVVGVAGASNAAGGAGVSGIATNGTGVLGNDLATSGSSTGVYGVSSSATGVGVYGQATSTSTSSWPSVGIYGTAAGIFGTGVEGTSAGIQGVGGEFYGGPSGTVSGSNVSGGSGVTGAGGNDTNSAGYGGGLGGHFTGGASTVGPGGDGADFFGGGSTGSFETGGNGIYAVAGPTNGFYNVPAAGVFGVGPQGLGSSFVIGPGIFGSDGTLSGIGPINYLGADIGVWGDTSATAGFGLVGTADNATAVAGENDSVGGYAAVSAANDSPLSTAVAIVAAINNLGLPPTPPTYAYIGGDGCSNTMGIQLALTGMSSNCENYTLQGDSSGNTYLNASGTGKIVFRINNGSGPSPMTLNNNATVTITSLDVTNSLTKPSGSFKIDHPLDPANKYLYHSFVESPDMMNVYNGNIATDGEGLATVTLPDWFEALNKDFRYQLTVIGQFAQAIVAKKIEQNQFQIRTNLPNVEVSWQVTGIRHDAFADAHRIQTEVEKAPLDRGHYLHPELFGAPETARIGYEAPSKLAPAEVSASSSATRSRVVTRRAPVIQRRPLPVTPKLPVLKTPTKPIVTQASR